MKSVVLPAAALAAAAFSIASFAQQPANPSSPATAPQRAPWYGGISFGRAELDNACVAGFSCEDRDNTYRLFAGTRFNRYLGVEIGALNLGKYDRGGGETDGWGADLALTAGVPLGNKASVFGKLGAIYSRTEVGGTAPGLTTGKERDWGVRYGIGGTFEIAPNWALRADWDRFDIALPGNNEDLDTFMLGVQYTFR